MSIGLIGRKVGMTQVFQDDGTMVAVSVLAIEPNTVTRLRTPDRDGYAAVQVGADRTAKLSKPRAGQLKALPKDAGLLGTRGSAAISPLFSPRNTPVENSGSRNAKASPTRQKPSPPIFFE